MSCFLWRLPGSDRRGRWHRGTTRSTTASTVVRADPDSAPTPPCNWPRYSPSAQRPGRRARARSSAERARSSSEPGATRQWRSARWDRRISLRGGSGHDIRRVAAGFECASPPMRQGRIRHDRAEEALGLFSFGDIVRLQGGRRTRSFDDDGLTCAVLCSRAGPCCRSRNGASRGRASCRSSGISSCRASCRGRRCRTDGGSSRAHGSGDRGRLQL
jgi:hypothetical protein